MPKIKRGTTKTLPTIPNKTTYLSMARLFIFFIDFLQTRQIHELAFILIGCYFKFEAYLSINKSGSDGKNPPEKYRRLSNFSNDYFTKLQ
jgi:hypothetical protein